MSAAPCRLAARRVFVYLSGAFTRVQGDLQYSGIFRAAFVSARETLAFGSLLCRNEANPSLMPEDAIIARDLLDFSVLAFWDCIVVLRREKTRLTVPGEAILDDRETYMTANFTVEAC